MKKYITLLILALASVTLMASDVDSHAGEYGFQVMKIKSSPIQAALAGNGLTNENDPFRSQNYPSVMVAYGSKVASASYNSWMFEDTPLSSVAAQIESGKYAFGVGFRYLDYGEINATDESANFISIEQPLDLIASANFGMRINPSLYAGINGNFLYEKISSAASMGYSFDFGLTYKSTIKNLDFHTALLNLGKTSAMNEEDIDLPKVFSFAATYKYDFEKFSIKPEISFESMSDEDLIMNISNQLTFKILDFRLGYKDGHDTQKLTTGFGINLEKVSVNYSFLPVEDEDLNDVHMFGISYKL